MLHLPEKKLKLIYAQQERYAGLTPQCTFFLENLVLNIVIYDQNIHG